MAYRIPEETIEEIRERTDIVELVSEYVSLKKRGPG
jgi:DNA primase